MCDFNKPNTTIKKQIDILRQRNMTINPEEEKEIEIQLIRSTYYNVINSTGFFFKETRIVNGNQIETTNFYKKGVTFKEIYSIYMFEKDLKSTLFKYVIKAEDLIKSVIVYVFAKNHEEAHSYLDVNEFCDNIHETIEVISKLNSVIKKCSKHNKEPVCHYLKRHKKVPIWVLAKELDFGTISRFYNVLCKSDQDEIAKEITKVFSFYNDNKTYLRSQQLQNYIESLRIFRNTLAHDNRIINYKGIGLQKHDLNKDCDHTKEMKSVYDIFLILKLFLNRKDYKYLSNSIKTRFKKTRRTTTSICFNEITKSLGFPDDWEC